MAWKGDLWSRIQASPVFDQHCHPTLRPNCYAVKPLSVIYGESSFEEPTTIAHRRNSAFLLRNLAASLDKDASCEQFLLRANCCAVVVDDGYGRGADYLRFDEMHRNAFRVARVELLMEECLSRAASLAFGAFVDLFSATVRYCEFCVWAQEIAQTTPQGATGAASLCWSQEHCRVPLRAGPVHRT
jgi:hypothetical protein